MKTISIPLADGWRFIKADDPSAGVDLTMQAMSDLLDRVDIEGNDYRYGIRTIEFHADERRFQLNGRTVPLNGVSMHHDFGVLGAAWNRAAQKRRLLLFKEAGVNAIRSSHNPPDEGLLELCDELGLLVKDEVFDEWRKKPAFTDPAAQGRALAEVGERGMTRAAIHSCNTGFLDQAGFKKDAFWLFQSRWRPDFPMAHILPHWNWAGREGEVTPVYVFTSGDEGELFLNGRSLGRRRKEPGVWDRAYRLRWDDVRYEPGILEVVVYKDGAEWARDRVETAGAPSKLVIEPECDTVLADGEDVCYVNVSVRDAAGRVVPRASNRIDFSVEGPAEIVATDNGDETDFDDFRQPSRKAFNGWAQVIVRAREGESGEICVVAVSEGLESASVELSV